MLPLNSRIPAFSLIELLVVMVLSTIVVGIIYFAYYSVSTYHLQLTRKQRATEDLSSLYFLLKSDAGKSRLVVANDALSISCIGENDKHVNYIFDSLFVLRTQRERVDTFHCSIDQPAYFFNKNSVTTYPGTIDAFEIRLNDMPLPASIYVLKQYDAASLISLTKRDSVK